MIVKRKRKSSTSSEDDLPLSWNKESHKFISKRDLLKTTIEKCQICDEVFFNMYSMLLHNTKHIIIPLLRQTIYQCSECNQPFITTEALKRHTFDNHLIITNKMDYVPDVIESFILKEPYALVNKEELPINEENNVTMGKEAEELLQLFVGSQPVTVLTKEPLFCEKIETNQNLLQDFVKHESVILEPLIIPIDDDSNEGSTENTCFESRNPNKIRDKICFESDSEEEKDIVKIPSGLINDLTNYCNVNIEPLYDKCNETCVNNKITTGEQSKHYNGSENSTKTSRSNTIILGQYPTTREWKSVHYDKLINSGEYRCMKCNEYFPNRYTAIIHETYHMNVRKRLGFLCRFCDWYIDNDRWTLNRHLLAKHPEIEYEKTKHIYKCGHCGLKYHNKKRHYLNYHPDHNITEQNNTEAVATAVCSEVKQQKADVGTNTSISKTIKKIFKVCELCSFFFTNKGNHSYKYLGSSNELGVRQRCENCEKQFFELKIIHSCYNYNKTDKRKKQKKDKKLKTNMERLKCVQNRIKKLKLLNKL